jgi:hypothetical protein
MSVSPSYCLSVSPYSRSQHGKAEICFFFSSPLTIKDFHMGLWQEVPMDSLKFQLGPPCPTLLCPAGRPLLKRPYGHFRGGWPAAVFYPFGHLTPYAYAPLTRKDLHKNVNNFFCLLIICIWRGVSKGVEAGRKAISGVARPQGEEG